MTRRTSLLAILLLASAATANAECAWVLWSGTTSPLAGYASQQECERARSDDHALAQLLSREYTLPPQALECRPDTEITQTPSRCGWMLWKFGALSRATRSDALAHSAIGIFETRDLCERWRAPDVMRREERELTACLPDTVDPNWPKAGDR